MPTTPGNGQSGRGRPSPDQGPRSGRPEPGRSEPGRSGSGSGSGSGRSESGRSGAGRHEPGRSGSGAASGRSESRRPDYVRSGPARMGEGGPIRGQRPTARIAAKRTKGDVMAGLAALVVLLLLLGGVPLALFKYVGPPLSPELLNLDLITSQVGISTVIAILILLVWIAWLQLVICVVVEVYGGIRRVGMPSRVPLSGGTQALANRLVSAVLLLFTVGAVAVPIAGFASSNTAGTTVAAVAYASP